MNVNLSPNVMLGIGIGTYDHLPPLGQAVPDVEKIAERLSRDGFTADTILDCDRNEIVDRFREALPADGMRKEGTVLVVLWNGHASQEPGVGNLRLLGCGNKADDPEAAVFTAAQLAELAARSGAAQLLLLIDTCYSGSGVVDVAKVIDAVRGADIDQAHRWMGIVASCQAYERAVDGALTSKLLELLENGPRQPELRVRWSSYQAGLRGDDLIDALVKEWDEDERQSPKVLSGGDPWLVLPNPLFDPDAREQVVEHLLWAARGASPNESGVWFVGRERYLREIVSWIGRRDPGTCLITGRAGCGKSAVAGRLVSLSNADERETIMRAQGPVAAELDPGEGSIDAHIQVRGMTLERCAEVLGRHLGVIGAATVPNHHDLLSWASAQEKAPIVVVDGLDEAGAEGKRIATDLLRPLGRHALVIVASREVPGVEEGSSLLDALGSPALRADLDEDREATDRDLYEYVVQRLTKGGSIPPTMDADLIAREVVQLAHGKEGRDGAFLLARLITAQLLEHPVDTSDPDWRTRLAHTVEDALEQDLVRGRPLQRDDEELPQAGRELLTALAYSYGSGFPADDVWPQVATALSPTGVEYTRQDCFWALAEHGRYITASGQSGQAVYRLHERLASSLRAGLAVTGEGEGGDLGRAAAAVLSAYERFLAHGGAATEHAYLWLYAWRHAVDAGMAGIAGLERLAAQDTALFPDLGLALNSQAQSASALGQAKEAIALGERAVAVYEEVAGVNSRYANDLANALSNLGVFYSEFGMRSEAVAPSERAVEIYEELSEGKSTHRAELGVAYGNLGSRYAEVGRAKDAVELTERALKIHEELAEQDPAYRKELAASLSNLGSQYGNLGKNEEAIPPAEKAVELYEQLAEEGPIFRRDLASALNNLGVRYSAVGRFDDAIRPTVKAAEIASEIAAENPALAGDWAGALSNLGAIYSKLGKTEEALPPTQEAAEIYERLAKENPAYLVEWSGTLHNLGNRYSSLGRYAEALAQTEKAVELRQELARENPAFRGDLASSLNSLGNRFVEVDKRSVAIGLAEEAVEIYEGLARENQSYLNSLAMALNNLGHRYRMVGMELEALRPIKRSVAIRESLSETIPEVRPDLADSLRSLATVFIRLEQPEEALEPTQRAIEIYEQLGSDNPKILRDLSSALESLGTIRASIGQTEEALEPAEKSAEIREELARRSPIFNADLAATLNNLSNLYNIFERREQAKKAASRALEIYEGLRESSPTASHAVAICLGNLARASDNSEAIELLERAVDIYEDLAEREPSYAGPLCNALNNLSACWREAEKAGEGEQRWDAAFARFSERGEVAVTLRLRRPRGDETASAHQDLIEAFLLSEGSRERLLFELHQECRSMRAAEEDAFDDRWRRSAGDLPAWLCLREKTMQVCKEWLEIDEWRESLEFLKNVEEELVSDQGLTAVAEFQLLAPNRIFDQHREILEVSRDQGIETAFEPVLAREAIQKWLNLSDLEESKRFLLDHRDMLLGEQAISAVGEDVSSPRWALLHLAKAGDGDAIEKAYELLADPEKHAAALARCRREGDFRRLRATAILCLARPQDDDDAAQALLHLAMAHAAEGEAEEAERVIRSIEKLSGMKKAAIDTLADAVTQHPDHAKELAELIRIVSITPESPEPQG